MVDRKIKERGKGATNIYPLVRIPGNSPSKTRGLCINWRSKNHPRSESVLCPELSRLD